VITRKQFRIFTVMEQIKEAIRHSVLVTGLSGIMSQISADYTAYADLLFIRYELSGGFHPWKMRMLGVHDIRILRLGQGC